MHLADVCDNVTKKINISQRSQRLDEHSEHVILEVEWYSLQLR